MIRSLFGGTHNDVVLDTRDRWLKLAEVTLTLWDSPVGGTRYTDLLDHTGAAVSAIRTPGGQVPVFQGPDGVTEMWADDGDNDRHLMLATDAQGIAAIRDEAVQAAASVAREEAGGVAGLDSAGKLYLERIPAGVVRAGDLTINAADYGLSTAATAAANVTALNNAVAAANAKGPNAELYLPPGTYPINGTVQIDCHLRGEQATLSYTGTGTALVIGVNTPGSLTSRKSFKLPRVVKPTQDWDGTSVGVRLVNLNTCDLFIPFVQNFERGLLMYGYGGGCTYCTVTLGALWQNHKNLVMDCDATGYVTQNTILGGRLQQTITGAGAVNEDPGANQILLGDAGGGTGIDARPNNNTFIGTSVEGDNPAYYRLDVHGRYNKFINCRWENFGSESRVRWNADALYNQIEHGYGADELAETVVAGSAGNEIRDRFGAYIMATNTAGQIIPNAAYTSLTGWTNTDSKRAPHTAANGSWTPRQGRWRISASVTFNSNGTGARRVGIYAGSTQIRQGDAPPNAGAATQVRVNGTYRFDGLTALTIRAYQTSGGDLSISASPGFTYIDAEYVGP